MRRLASVFSSKREPPSTNPSHAPGSQVSLSLKKNVKRANSLATVSPLNTTSFSSNDSAPSTPALSAPSQSSASSTGSASCILQTPEPDDDLGIAQTPKAKSWKFWSTKRSGTIKQVTKAIPDAIHHPNPTPMGSSAPQLAGEETTSSESDDEEDDDEESISEHAMSRLIAPTTAQPTYILQVIIQNSLRHRLSPPPLLHRNGLTLYPRSCNRPRALPAQETLRSIAAKKTLLRRLKDSSLSSADLASLQSLAGRPLPSLMPSDPSDLMEAAPAKSSVISQFSTGIRRWIMRPCFEDRFAVWVAEEDVVNRHNVTAAMGVAALEYSPALEAMVDYNPELTPVPPHPATELPPLQLGDSPANSDPNISPSSSSSSLSMAQSRNSPYIGIPSPLRNEHSPVLPPSQVPPPLEPPESSTHTETQSVTTPAPTVKRGVRFAEDDKDDVIPIGYALRIKKQREDKARFLREQQEQRLLAEERTKVEIERKRMEQERLQWEQERQAWEAEKRAMEAEKMKRLYAEEVAASRERRESQRMGNGSRVNPSASSTTSLKDHIRNKPESQRISRPVYDTSRRQASEPTVATVSPAHSSGSSPSSSRPSSINGHGMPSPNLLNSTNSLAPPHPNSRSPSVHSTHSMSSEDVHLRQSATKKRHSIASSSVAHRPAGDRTSSYSMWSASNPTLLGPVPPIPSFPNSMDMPLLPPTAPFMLYQYPRPRSTNNSPSSSPSASPSRHRVPSSGSNPSSEQVNVQNHNHRHSSSPSPHRVSGSPASPHRPSHQRQSSGDSRRSSFAPSSFDDRGRAALPSGHRSQPNTIGRSSASRNTVPTLPSPWTALPSRDSIVAPIGARTSSYNDATRANNHNTESKGMTLPRTHRQHTVS